MSRSGLNAVLPSAGAIVAGKYRVGGLLGRGAMGVVYSATHVVTGAPVALKWLSSTGRDVEQRARLYREAQAAGRVVHPNVVKVHDVGQHEDAIFLVMERLVGRSLGDAMEAREPLSAPDAVRLLMPAFRALAAAHAAGVIHRDLKPDNLFLAEDGAGHTTIKVLDFGISKVDNGPELALTETGVVLGTPLYMAPEQLRGVKDLDGRCDQYALACILYELVEGIAPFDGDNYAELAASKLKSSPRPFGARVPPAFASAVMRALATAPKDRFADVAAFATALESVAEGARFSDDADVSGLFPSVAAVAAGEYVPSAATTRIDAPRARVVHWLWLVGAVLVLAIALAWSLRPSASTTASATGRATALPPAAEPPSVPVEEVEVVSTAIEPLVEPATVEAATVDELEADVEADVDEPEVDEVETEPRTTRRRSTGRHRTGGVRLDDF